MADNTEKKIIFKDIVIACTFGKVKQSLLTLYPDQKRNISAYKNIFETLQRLRHRNSKEGMTIHIGKVGKGKNAYFSVSGIRSEEGDRQLYALEYTAWSKWLGYEVNKGVLKKLSNEDIVAHCLWEMTFAGFTQKKIRRRIASLRKQIKDVEEGRVKTIPHEEAMALFENKFKDK